MPKNGFQSRAVTVVCVLLAAALLSGCAVTTERFAPEYSRDYVLAHDTRVRTDCALWTGFYSLNFGGLETVPCLVFEGYNPATLPPEILERDKHRIVVFKKGSPVRIKRIFTIVHESETIAELAITDLDSGVTTPVFGEHWPRRNPHVLDAK